MDDNHRKEFGKRLLAARTKSGLTQDKLAEKAGLDRVTINRIENGKFKVGLDILNKIAIALDSELGFKPKQNILINGNESIERYVVCFDPAIGKDQTVSIKVERRK